MALVKCANRRIYDNEAHRYFRVEELRLRLLNGEKVTSKVTGEDTTHELLLGLLTFDLKNDKGPESDHLRRFIQDYSTKKVML